MHEGNYEAALEKYSQCGQLWNTSNKELEAKYQTAEAYLQNGDYEVALKWFTKCGNYKDTEDEVEEVKRKITEALLQPLGLKVNSPAEIYTLGNAIPCGLVKYPISYDTILSVNSGALVDETESALTCEDYFLYDCSCEIKYFFDSNKLLSKMEVVGPYMHDKEDFMDEAIRKIANKMQDELNVRPYIHQANTCSYKFIKDGVVYVMDSEEDAFSRCEQLEKIRFSQNLIQLGGHVFSLCENLKELDLPSSLRRIGTDCFFAAGIEHIVIPQNLEVIPKGCFWGCSRLRKIFLNENLKKIEGLAFSGSMPDEIIVPKSVDEVDVSAFSCSGLRRLWLAFLGMTTKFSNFSSEISHFEGIIYCLPGSEIQKQARQSGLEVRPLSEFKVQER